MKIKTKRLYLPSHKNNAFNGIRCQRSILTCKFISENMFAQLKYIVFALLFSICPALAQSCDYSVDHYSYRFVKNQFVGIATDYLNKPDSLHVDIFYPVGDKETERPLVIWFFGGAFVAGSRETMHKNCISFAQKGFVAVAADYRIGMVGNLLPVDQAEVMRAGYRAMQDAKAVVRWMKARNVLDSTDVDRVWVGGESAGGFTALAAAFVDQEKEKPKECGKLASVIGVGRPDLGSVEGQLHQNGWDAGVQGVFNYYGGVLDTSMITGQENTALFLYHQTGDPVVACGGKRPFWTLPISSNFPIAYGSCAITERLTHLSYGSTKWSSWIHTGDQHAVHDQLAVDQYMLHAANPLLCRSITSSDPLSKIERKSYTWVGERLEFQWISTIFESTGVISIFNLSGAELGKYASEEVLDQSDKLLPGVYFLSFEGTDGDRKLARWIKF